MEGSSSIVGLGHFPAQGDFDEFDVFLRMTGVDFTFSLCICINPSNLGNFNETLFLLGESYEHSLSGLLLKKMTICLGLMPAAFVRLFTILYSENQYLERQPEAVQVPKIACDSSKMPCSTAEEMS